MTCLACGLDRAHCPFRRSFGGYGEALPMNCERRQVAVAEPHANIREIVIGPPVAALVNVIDQIRKIQDRRSA